jgi:glycosyltransferase involved in cell wall biosynthesis
MIIKPNQRVLFLGHDASRTGAPLLLLELIKWFNEHSTVRSSLYLKRGGEIISEYQTVAPTVCLAQDYEDKNKRLHWQVLRKLGLSTKRQPNLKKLYRVEKYPLVYANTIDTCDLAMQLKEPGRRLIHHIHELAYTTSSYGALEMLEKAVPFTDSYIAVSRAVQEFLVNKIGVPNQKIRVIHEFPIASAQSNNRNESREEIRQRLDISKEAFTVGMCGSPQWRKGIDLFVQLAMQAKRRLGNTQCHFVWLGGDAESHREALHDVSQLGLQRNCHFVQAVSEPVAYYNAFDLFALTSREDPFSVAMLEAAAAGLPIICFANAGGAPELVEDDAGIVVPYLDVPAMAQACVDLLLDEKRRKELGQNAKTKVQTRYFLAVQGPKFLEVLNQTLNEGRIF